ncbi:MAG: hypothetical protein GF381_02015 [Candidatus Pacebacteria bacterium]|nr:hypothetical protein [Candidatus Paceibacterota bacterium]
MNNQLFLQNYQHLQYGIMYHKLIDLGYASIAWCRTYDSSFFNHAQVNGLVNKKQLDSIEKELANLDRNPALYFENKQQNTKLVKYLESQGYKKTWEDSWMFHQGTNIGLSKTANVTKVTTESELDEFIDTFDQCYQKDDPQNPYGELGDYLDVARHAWQQHSQTGKIEYFTVFDEDRPVAVSTLTNFAGIGYISNVGSLKSERGKGFGKIASLYAVKQSVKNGNRFHALATEEGDYPNEFYKRIGFVTMFSALGYTKE